MNRKRCYEIRGEPTMSIHQLKDDPEVEKPFSLPILILASLSDWTLLKRERARCVFVLV